MKITIIYVGLAVEYKQGSYAARNKGVELAKGRIIAFTDADYIPDKSWLERRYSYLVTSPKCHVLGGNVVSVLANEKKPSIVERYQLVTGFSQQRLIRERHYAVTANVFAKREVFNDVGLFDDSLKSGGDLDWGKRVSEAAYSLAYAHDVIVMHPVRTSLRSLINQARRMAGGRYELKNKKQKITL